MIKNVCMLGIGLLLFSILGLSKQALAQGLGCGSTYQMRQAELANPALRAVRAQLEAETQRYLANKRAARAGSDTDRILVIPVVFHIMHNNGSENISDAQVIDAIRVINLDYVLAGYDTNQISPLFKPRAGNIRFQFRLAAKDPNGNCTNGITRHVTPYTVSTGDQVKSIVSWNTRKYLNVWVVKTITLGTFQAGGYSYYPGGAPSDQYDGVMTVATQTGSIGQSSQGCNLCMRTLTHEIGHYFNLAHTWGDEGGSAGDAINCQNGDDRVDDTPPTTGTGDGGCDLNQANCGPIANVENYMDYSGCGRMFTLGQKDRMRAAAYSAIQGRSNLWSQDNLIATGVADPYAPANCLPQLAAATTQYSTCAGENVRLGINLGNSNADSTVINWYLPGADVQTATGIAPMASYSTPGVYPVTVYARNRAGADSLTVADYVYVNQSTGVYTLDQVEGLEDPAFPRLTQAPFGGWQLSTTASSGTQWSRVLVAGQGYSLRLQPSTATPAGSKVAAISPPFDLRGVSSGVALYFKYAGAARSQNSADVLKVYASSNCGRSYVQRLNLTENASLANSVYTTAGTFNGLYRPSRTDWVVKRIPLPTFAGQAGVRFKFEVTTSSGNALYIDSLVVSDPLATAPLLADQIAIAPNPASGVLHLTLPANAQASTYAILDALGRQVGTGRGQPGDNAINLSALPTGAYQIRIISAGHIWHRHFVVE